MPVFWNWLESNSWRLAHGFATNSADAKRVLCPVQRLQFLCVELHFSPLTVNGKCLQHLRKSEGSTMLFNKNANLVFFPSAVLFFICFDTRFLQGTEPFASFLKFSSLKVFALCWELATAKLWPSATTGFIQLTQLYSSCLRRTNPSWRGPRLWPLCKITCFNLHCTLIPK